jgi:hypothetical protein
MPPEKFGRGELAIYDNRNKLKAARSKKYGNGMDLVTKVYPTDVIPDQPPKSQLFTRPNNFMSAMGDYQTSKGISKL